MTCHLLVPDATATLQVRCDEKGFLAICAFGLPGKTHEDGPARGIQAALSIVDALRAVDGVCLTVLPSQAHAQHPLHTHACACLSRALYW